MKAENDKMKSTGERIKALLNEKKMTQRQLSELSGVTESAISHYIKETVFLQESYQQISPMH